MFDLLRRLSARNNDPDPVINTETLPKVTSEVEGFNHAS